jgi:hypothetical protein
MKKRKYMSGGDVAEVGLEEYVKKSKKPLPSETIKEDKRAKAVNEGVRDTIIETVKGAPAAAMAAGKKIYENVMGTPEQNRKAAEEMKNYPPEQKFQKMKRSLGMGEEESKKKGGKISYKSGGSVSSASKRADGCAVRGKTKGRMV